MPTFVCSIRLEIEAPDEATAEAVQRRAVDYVIDLDDGGSGAGIVTGAGMYEGVKEEP